MKNHIRSLQEDIHSLQIEKQHLQDDANSLQMENLFLKEQVASFQDDFEIVVDQKIKEKIVSLGYWNGRDGFPFQLLHEYHGL